MYNLVQCICYDFGCRKVYAARLLRYGCCVEVRPSLLLMLRFGVPDPCDGLRLPLVSSLPALLILAKTSFCSLFDSALSRMSFFTYRNSDALIFNLKYRKEMYSRYIHCNTRTSSTTCEPSARVTSIRRLEVFADRNRGMN